MLSTASRYFLSPTTCLPTSLRHVARISRPTQRSVRGKAYKPNTVATRFRCLQQFFRWALEEDEIERSPFGI